MADKYGRWCEAVRAIARTPDGAKVLAYMLQEAEFYNYSLPDDIKQAAYHAGRCASAGAIRSALGDEMFYKIIQTTV